MNRGALADALRGLAALVRCGLARPQLPRPGLLALAARLPHRELNLGTAVQLHAAQRGSRRAIVDDRGALTWAELDDRVTRLANALLDRVGEGRRVGFMVFNGREAVECYAACGRAGCVAVPINTWAGPGELGHVAETQQLALLIVDDDLAAVAEQAAPSVAMVRVGDHANGYEAVLAAAAGARPTVRGTGEIVTHTSGTTGQPKGAERDVGASGLTALVRFVDKVPVHADDRWLIAAPLFHTFGQGMMAVGLVLGATLVLPRRFTPDGVLAMARHTDVTAAALVPAMLKRMLAADNPAPPPRLRLAVLSGSPLPGPLRQRAEDVYGRIFYDVYGSTEVGWAAIATPADQAAKPGTVGAPGRGMRVVAVADDGRVLPPGEVGRLHVATGFEFSGYTGMGLGGRQVVDGAIEFGDTGWVDADGSVFLAGRADDMIVSGGENIYPAEVAEALEAHGGVADVAVVGVADEDDGEALHAVVVPADGSGLTADEVRDHVKSRLARYKAPKHVTFVDEIPRNAVGKVVTERLPATPS